MGLGYHQRTGLDLGPGGACEQIPGNVHINHNLLIMAEPNISVFWLYRLKMKLTYSQGI